MAVDVVIPEMGESITEAVLIEWLKEEGAYVERDEPLCVLETDKANVDLPSPAAGILRRLKELDTTLEVGDLVARVEVGGEAGESPEERWKEEVTPVQAETAIPGGGEEESGRKGEEELSPAVRRLVAEHGLDPAAIQGTGKGGRVTKEDVLAYLEEQERRRETEAPEPAAVEAPMRSATSDQRQSALPLRAAAPATVRTVPQAAPTPAPPAAPLAPKPAPPARPVAVEVETPGPAPTVAPAGPKPAPSARPVAVKPVLPRDGGEGIRREPMSRIRQRIAQHLVAAQHNAAMLTTFNEVDMSGVMALRGKYKERFAEVHGVSLGLMSFFSRAVVLALGEFPAVNAFVEGDEIVYHDYVNLGIAVSTDRGLLVPVLRRAEQMSMARIESEIKRLATGARDNKLNLDELSGGTFTITNGGVFGSLLSTPILNAPQSGILGMHAIQQRPVAVDGRVEIRPMMYVALSYDHRLIDGQTSVSFLVRVKQRVEDPARLLLQI